MEPILDYPTGWYIQMTIIYGTLLLVYFLRKSHKNKGEVKKMFLMGTATLIFAFIGEFVGISNKLWTYFPGNWPLPVWIGYFGLGLLGYQFAKLIEEKVK